MGNSGDSGVKFRPLSVERRKQQHLTRKSSDFLSKWRYLGKKSFYGSADHLAEDVQIILQVGFVVVFHGYCFLCFLFALFARDF